MSAQDVMTYDDIIASGSANDGTPTPLILSSNSARKMVTAQDPATAPTAPSDYDYFRGKYAVVGDGKNVRYDPVEHMTSPNAASNYQTSTSSGQRQPTKKGSSSAIYTDKNKNNEHYQARRSFWQSKYGSKDPKTGFHPQGGPDDPVKGGPDFTGGKESDIAGGLFLGGSGAGGKSKVPVIAGARSGDKGKKEYTGSNQVLETSDASEGKLTATRWKMLRGGTFMRNASKPPRDVEYALSTGVVEFEGDDLVASNSAGGKKLVEDLIRDGDFLYTSGSNGNKTPSETPRVERVNGKVLLYKNYKSGSGAKATYKPLRNPSFLLSNLHGLKLQAGARKDNTTQPVGGLPDGESDRKMRFQAQNTKIKKAWDADSRVNKDFPSQGAKDEEYDKFRQQYIYRNRFDPGRSGGNISY